MDSNHNGVPDSAEVSFHLKSSLMGAVVALLIGGTTFTVAGAVFPDSSLVRAVGKAFAGGVCDPIKEKSNYLEKVVVCYHSTVTDSVCENLLKGKGYVQNK